MARSKKGSTQSVNAYLKDLREAAGMTQMEVAHFLGHSTAQYISNLERELCDASVEMAIRLCEFYGGNRNELYQLMLSLHVGKLKKVFAKKSA